MRKWWAIGAAVLLLSAAALGVWYKRPHHSPQPPLLDLKGADSEVVEAIEEARRKVLRRPSAQAWGRLGEVLLVHDFAVEATECLAEAERLDPHEPTWPYLQGWSLATHDPVRAIPCLQRAVRCTTVKEPTARLLLAETLLNQDRVDEAEALLHEVHQADSENARATVGLARVAMLRQQWQSARDMLKTCQNDPHARKCAHSLLAEVWNQLHDAKRARQEQREAGAAPPDQPWPDPYHDAMSELRRGVQARFAAITAAMQAHRFGDAIRLLQETLRAHPDSLEGWMRLGGMLTQAQRLEQAEACFQRAVRLSPDLAEAWSRLGTVQMLRHSPQAGDSLRTAIRLKPDHAQAHYNLGQFLLREQGNQEAAAEEFRTALRCRPDYDPARQALKDMEKPKPKAKDKP